MMHEQKLLTPDEVAGRWGLHKATVLRLFHSGMLPGITLCRGKARSTVRFRLAAVEAFERRHERNGAQERRHEVVGK